MLSCRQPWLRRQPRMQALARAAPGLLLGRWSRPTAAAVTATTATATITNAAMSTSTAAAAGTRPVLRPGVAARPSDGMFRRQARGKRTRTVVHLDDLPQGIVLPSGALNETQAGEGNRTTRNRSSTGGKSRGSVAGTADDETTATATATATASATVDSPSSGSPAYPTVVLQARRNMQKFADCVLLTRVGGFYELYFEHAQEFGPLLNLKVAAKRTNAGPVPMAGFPFFQLDRFLKVLVHDLNRYVAIAEEYPHSAADKIKSGGLMHDRRVARIVTPGTLIDEHFMDPYTNNYVMAVHMSGVPSDDGAATSPPVPAFVPHPSPAPTHVAFAPAEPSVTAAAAPTSTSSASASVPASAPASTPAALSSVPLGLAWLDLSTGHFYTQTTTLAALGSVLARVAPREIVLDEEVQLWQGRNSSSSSNSSSIAHPLLTILDEDRQQQQQQQQRQVITYAPSPPSAADEGGSNGVSWLAEWAPMLESEIPAQTVQDITRPEVAAGSLLLHYVKDRLQGLAMKLQPPVRYEGMQIMTIDKNSMRSLEIKQTLRDGTFRGSLLHAIRRTVTKSGARLLNEWLSAPSTSLEVIVARQNLVSRFIQDEDLRDGITLLLRKSHDSHRLVQKFALGRGDPDDLLDLAKTVAATEDIVGLLQHARPQHADQEEQDCLVAVAERIQLERPRAVAQRIRDSVDEEGLLHQHELEENEADAMLSLAQDVVQAEGSLKTDGAGLRKTKSSGRDAKGATSASAAASASASASTPTDAPTAAAAAARRRSSKPTSVRDYYGEDNEAWVMKPSASEGLGVLHARLAALVREREALTDELRRRLKAPSLVLKWTPGLGHICHVRGRDATRGGRRKSKAGKADKADDEADEHEPAASPPSPKTTTTTTTTPTTVSSSRTTRSLHLPEWTALGQRLDQVRFQIRAEEQRVFHGLREAVVRSLVPLRRNAAVLDELDIATSFARLALEQNLSRPRLHRGTSTAIVGGRHPTVEGGLTEQGRSFTRNDCFVGSRGGAAGDQHGRVWLITGPNMAGKSTFLRQNALIVLLAQIGAYVPADCADLGLVDALFSRVGSADNLFRDQSTFMVEMLETAHILRQATPRSFVIMDEVGRGTTPEDGTAVAFAALHHLVHVNRCRTLFATHFHALADLAAGAGMTDTTTTTMTPTSTATEGPGVELYCTDVQEDDRGGFVYVHRLRRGVNRQSHALKVARLAGLPEQAIQVARDVLTKHGADLKIRVQTEDHEQFIENGRSKEATA